MKRFLILFFILFIAKNGCTQELNSCGFPLHVSADSLVNYIIADYKKKTGNQNSPISDQEWKKNCYNNTLGIKYDSAFTKCEEYLIQHIGKTVYCNYVLMNLNSFGIYGIQFSLVYLLQLPNLIHNHPCGYNYCNYETIRIEFKMQLQADSSLKITYPKNIPDCHELPDCGFKITKDSALTIAKKSSFINDSLNYTIETDGIDWIISLGEVLGEIKSIKINLQTGVQSSVQITHRID